MSEDERRKSGGPDKKSASAPSKETSAADPWADLGLDDAEIERLVKETTERAGKKEAKQKKEKSPKEKPEPQPSAAKPKPAKAARQTPPPATPQGAPVPPPPRTPTPAPKAAPKEETPTIKPGTPRKDTDAGTSPGQPPGGEGGGEGEPKDPEALRKEIQDFFSDTFGFTPVERFSLGSLKKIWDKRQEIKQVISRVCQTLDELPDEIYLSFGSFIGDQLYVDKSRGVMKINFNPELDTVQTWEEKIEKTLKDKDVLLDQSRYAKETHPFRVQIVRTYENVVSSVRIEPSLPLDQLDVILSGEEEIQQTLAHISQTLAIPLKEVNLNFGPGFFSHEALRINTFNGFVEITYDPNEYTTVQDWKAAVKAKLQNEKEDLLRERRLALRPLDADVPEDTSSPVPGAQPAAGQPFAEPARTRGGAQPAPDQGEPSDQGAHRHTTDSPPSQAEQSARPRPGGEPPSKPRERTRAQRLKEKAKAAGVSALERSQKLYRDVSRGERKEAWDLTEGQFRRRFAESVRPARKETPQRFVHGYEMDDFSAPGVIAIYEDEAAHKNADAFLKDVYRAIKSDRELGKTSVCQTFSSEERSRFVFCKDARDTRLGYAMPDGMVWPIKEIKDDAIVVNVGAEKPVSIGAGDGLEAKIKEALFEKNKQDIQQTAAKVEGLRLDAPVIDPVTKKRNKSVEEFRLKQKMFMEKLLSSPKNDLNAKPPIREDADSPTGYSYHILRADNTLEKFYIERIVPAGDPAQGESSPFIDVRVQVPIEAEPGKNAWTTHRIRFHKDVNPLENIGQTLAEKKREYGELVKRWPSVRKNEVLSDFVRTEYERTKDDHLKNLRMTYWWEGVTYEVVPAPPQKNDPGNFADLKYIALRDPESGRTTEPILIEPGLRRSTLEKAIETAAFAFETSELFRYDRKAQTFHLFKRFETKEKEDADPVKNIEFPMGLSVPEGESKEKYACDVRVLNNNETYYEAAIEYGGPHGYSMLLSYDKRLLSFAYEIRIRGQLVDIDLGVDLEPRHIAEKIPVGPEYKAKQLGNILDRFADIAKHDLHTTGAGLKPLELEFDKEIIRDGKKEIKKETVVWEGRQAAENERERVLADADGFSCKYRGSVKEVDGKEVPDGFGTAVYYPIKKNMFSEGYDIVSYRGGWNEGVYNGICRIDFENGAFFEGKMSGSVEDGERKLDPGHGIFYEPDGTVYRGPLAWYHPDQEDQDTDADALDELREKGEFRIVKQTESTETTIYQRPAVLYPNGERYYGGLIGNQRSTVGTTRVGKWITAGGKPLLSGDWQDDVPKDAVTREFWAPGKMGPLAKWQTFVPNDVAEDISKKIKENKAFVDTVWDDEQKKTKIVITEIKPLGGEPVRVSDTQTYQGETVEVETLDKVERKAHGLGTMTYTENHVFPELRADRDDPAVFISECTGPFVQGNRHGWFTIKLSNGKKVEWEYQNDQLHIPLSTLPTNNPYNRYHPNLGLGALTSLYNAGFDVPQERLEEEKKVEEEVQKAAQAAPPGTPPGAQKAPAKEKRERAGGFYIPPEVLLQILDHNILRDIMHQLATPTESAQREAVDTLRDMFTKKMSQKDGDEFRLLERTLTSYGYTPQRFAAEWQRDKYKGVLYLLEQWIEQEKKEATLVHIGTDPNLKKQRDAIRNKDIAKKVALSGIALAGAAGLALPAIAGGAPVWAALAVSGGVSATVREMFSRYFLGMKPRESVAKTKWWVPTTWQEKPRSVQEKQLETKVKGSVDVNIALRRRLDNLSPEDMAWRISKGITSAYGGEAMTVSAILKDRAEAEFGTVEERVGAKIDTLAAELYEDFHKQKKEEKGALAGFTSAVAKKLGFDGLKPEEREGWANFARPLFVGGTVGAAIGYNREYIDLVRAGLGAKVGWGIGGEKQKKESQKQVEAAGEHTIGYVQGALLGEGFSAVLERHGISLEDPTELQRIRGLRAADFIKWVQEQGKRQKKQLSDRTVGELRGARDNLSADQLLARPEFRKQIAGYALYLKRAKKNTISQTDALSVVMALDVANLKDRERLPTLDRALDEVSKLTDQTRRGKEETWRRANRRYAGAVFGGGLGAVGGVVIGRAASAVFRHGVMPLFGVKEHVGLTAEELYERRARIPYKEPEPVIQSAELDMPKGPAPFREEPLEHHPREPRLPEKLLLGREPILSADVIPSDPEIGTVLEARDGFKKIAMGGDHYIVFAENSVTGEFTYDPEQSNLPRHSGVELLNQDRIPPGVPRAGTESELRGIMNTVAQADAAYEQLAQKMPNAPERLALKSYVRSQLEELAHVDGIPKDEKTGALLLKDVLDYPTYTRYYTDWNLLETYLKDTAPYTDDQKVFLQNVRWYLMQIEGKDGMDLIESTRRYFPINVPGTIDVDKEMYAILAEHERASDILERGVYENKAFSALQKELENAMKGIGFEAVPKDHSWGTGRPDAAEDVSVTREDVQNVNAWRRKIIIDRLGKVVAK